jgi:hypothetical protein
MGETMEKRDPEAAGTAVPPADEELAARAAAGSRSAFEELVTRYGVRLLHFLRSRAGPSEDVEDLVQETFLKAYRNIGRYDPRRLPCRRKRLRRNKGCPSYEKEKTHALLPA